MAEDMQAMAAQRQQDIKNVIGSFGKRLLAFIRSRVSNQEDAEDILQDVWYQLNLQPELDTIGSISGWLYRVARNRIIDRGRKKREAPFAELEQETEEGYLLPISLPVDAADPLDEQQRALFWDVLFAALEELPANQRSVFERNELEELTLQQIADADGIPLKTAISRKRYAVQHLRRRLEEFYIDFLND